MRSRKFTILLIGIYRRLLGYLFHFRVEIMAAKKKCKYCGFFAYEMIKVNVGSFCSLGHAISWSRKKAEKSIAKKAKKAEAEKNKVHAAKKREFYDNDKPLRLREAQKAFNAFIRLRDKLLPCVSCGVFVPKGSGGIGGDYDCGHYLTRGGFPELRFEELNAHKQCKKCNAGSSKFSHKDKTVREEYRVELIKRIGIVKVDWLEGPHKAKKYSCADLKEIELFYKAKLKVRRCTSL